MERGEQAELESAKAVSPPKDALAQGHQNTTPNDNATSNTRLESLPTEMLDHIAESLNKEDLRSLRRVSRTLRDGCEKASAETLFGTLGCSFTSHSLQRILKISEKPAFAKHVKMLSLRAVAREEAEHRGSGSYRTSSAVADQVVPPNHQLFADLRRTPFPGVNGMLFRIFENLRHAGGGKIVEVHTDGEYFSAALQAVCKSLQRGQHTIHALKCTILGISSLRLMAWRKRTLPHPSKEDMVSPLFAIPQPWGSLQKLSFKCKNTLDASSKIIAGIIGAAPQLLHLEMPLCGVGLEHGVLSSLRYLEHLQTLNMPVCGIDLGGRAFDSLSALKKLESLSIFGDSPQTGMWHGDLLALLKAAPSSLPELKLHRLELKSGEWREIMAWVMSNMSLTKLVADHLSIPFEGVFKRLWFKDRAGKKRFEFRGSEASVKEQLAEVVRTATHVWE